MKCCICGCEITNYGNNPFPLCDSDDYESRCCDVCNEMVIKARIVQSKLKNKKLNVGDNIVIFYSKNSNNPTESIANGKFLAGIVEEVLEDKESTKYKGTWGNFVLNETDQYVNV